MSFAITLVDLNADLVAAWQAAFADAPEVRVVHGSILCEGADAWVTPTNARGRMDGGLDAVMKRYFGAAIEARVRREINARFGGPLPVGAATCVGTAGLWTPPTGPRPMYLISAPTMRDASQDVSRTLNAAWAFAAALQAAHLQNRMECGDGGIYSLAVPGLGAATGRLAPESCARQMRLAYGLFRDHAAGFDNFEAMRAALVARLVGDPVAPAAAAHFRNVPVTGVARARGGPRRRSLFNLFRNEHGGRQVRIA